MERITPRRTALPSATVADTAEQRVYKDFAERDLKEKSYLPKEFILCTLPHSNPGDVRVWSRRNGNYTLNVEPGYDEAGNSFGVPYGSIPRLVLCWITNEAIRTKDRKIRLGNSLAEFLHDIGLSNTSGGKRSSRRALEKHILSLCYCKMRFHFVEGDAQQGRRQSEAVSVSNRQDFWWNYTNAQQTSFFDSSIWLSEEFFEAILQSPVPLSTDALMQLKKSPLAIDLYAMVSYRLYVMGEKGRLVDTIPMAALRSACGSEYGRRDNFKAALTRAMSLIKTKAWPMLNYEISDEGIAITTSPLTIARRRKTRHLLPGQRSQADTIAEILKDRRIDQETRSKAKALAPKWDMRTLEEAFWEWLKESEIEAKDPRPLFLSFVRTHDKLNR
jgi:hypothetical protein